MSKNIRIINISRTTLQTLKFYLKKNGISYVSILL